MQITVRPSKASGTVASPPSKSAAHRSLICAGLARGESTVRGISRSEDISATLDCLSALGADPLLSEDGSTVRIRGTDPARFDGSRVLPCRECGSTLRFLIPLALTGTSTVTLTGSEKLLSRPLEIYADLAAEHGVKFENTSREVRVQGPLTGGSFRFSGDVSSQFVSGLLFALPLLGEDSRIELIPPVASKPYIDLTVDALERFGVRCRISEDGTVIDVPGRQTYTPRDVTVEGDYSNAAFLDAFNLLGGNVRVTGLLPDSLQGDRVYRSCFERLRNGFCKIDLTDCPDLGPILFVAASLFEGAHFTGTRRLRIKESDRVAAMAEELGKCGVRTQIGEDEVTVAGGGLHSPREALCGHNDHRIVMALTVLLSMLGGTLLGAEAVKKSFPDFFEVIQHLGIEVM